MASLNYFAPASMGGISRYVLGGLVFVGSTFGLLALFFSDRAPYSGRWRVMIPLGKFEAELERAIRDGLLKNFAGKVRADDDPVYLRSECCIVCHVRICFSSSFDRVRV